MGKFCPDYHFTRSDSVFPVSIRELSPFKTLYTNIVYFKNIVKEGLPMIFCKPFSPGRCGAHVPTG